MTRRDFSPLVFGQIYEPFHFPSPREPRWGPKGSHRIHWENPGLPAMPPKLCLGYSPNDTHHHEGAHYDVEAYIMARQKTVGARKLSDRKLGVYLEIKSRIGKDA